MPGSIGRARRIGYAFSMARAARSANAMLPMMEAAWRRCVTGWRRRRELCRIELRWQSRPRVVRWSRRFWSAALRSMPSIPNGLIAFVTASRWQERRTIAVMLRFWLTRWSPTDTPIAVSWSMIRWSSSCASGRGWLTISGRNTAGWPTGYASSCGGTIPRCSSLPVVMLPAAGCSSCGKKPRRQPRRHRCRLRPSSRY